MFNLRFVLTQIKSHLRATASKTRVDNQRCRRKKSTHIATAVRSMLPIRADTYLSSGLIYEAWPGMGIMPKSPCAANNSFSWESFTDATFVWSHRPRAMSEVVDWRPAMAIREAMLAMSSPFSFHQHAWTNNNNEIIRSQTTQDIHRSLPTFASVPPVFTMFTGKPNFSGYSISQFFTYAPNKM